MIVWIFLIIYLLLLRLLMGSLNTKYKQKLYLILSGIVIVLIMGFRYPKYNIVYDLEIYYNYYKNLSYLSWKEIFDYSRFEYGYAILNKLLVSIVPWPQFIIIFEAFICVYSMFRFIYKYSNNAFWGVLFYVTLGTMSFQLTAFRQAFAISICLYSIDYIKQHKILKFLVLVLIAATFHKTAIVFLPLYFIGQRKLNLKNNLISIICIVILISSANWITNFGNEILGMNYKSIYIGNEFGGIVPILIYIITIVLSWINLKNESDVISLNMTEMGLGIYAMRYSSIALERISFYYTPSIVISLPNVLNSFNDRKIQFIIKLCALILAILLFYHRLTYSEWADYKFFWQ